MIILDENYKLIFSEYNVTLDYEKELDSLNPKTRKPKTSTSQTFHGNLKQALKAYCQKKLEECSTIEEVLEKINMLENKIDNLKKRKSC